MTYSIFSTDIDIDKNSISLELTITLLELIYNIWIY